MRLDVRMRRWPFVTALVGLTLALSSCIGKGPGQDPSAALLSDQSNGRNWAGYGRTDGQQNYSPLDEINQSNVGGLGLAWSMDLPPANSNTQPIEVHGVLYFATGLSIVHAVDAVTGKQLWQFDPQAAKDAGLNLRAAWGVRGVAWWDGKIYVGVPDGRLIALDAKTGKPVWSAQTISPKDPAQVNGAPRVFNGRVLIGFGSTTGAMRGYVSAYDAKTGKLLWRFWTVPGNPSKPLENKAMKMAAKTWSGHWWKYGGGGTVWNSMAYDPETDTVYIGVGSPYPWNQRIRSDGKGDNLFVDSIVALDGKTGKYKWHYQTTPGDDWDFDATMDIELADLKIDGKMRKVLVQAPKNGFFYVIDRVTGKLISAEPYVPVTWASHVDLRTGRPVELPGARYTPDGNPVLVSPTSLGGHNWMSMATSPETDLVYIPAIHFEANYSDINYRWKPSTDRTTDGGVNIAGGPGVGMPPATGSLIAWDPVSQKPVWSVPYPTYLNGGVLATGGDLVFQGTIDGWLKAYDADTGKLAWKFDAKAPILATPISYEVGGIQYITVLTGSGMGIAMYANAMDGPSIQKYDIDPLTQARRVLTFAIGGKGTLPPRLTPPPPPPDPDFKPNPARQKEGYISYEAHCLNCHGDSAVGIGNGPDLRRSSVPLDRKAFEKVVRGGSLEAKGMPKFDDLSRATVENIRQYLRARAEELRNGTPQNNEGKATNNEGEAPKTLNMH